MAYTFDAVQGTQKTTTYYLTTLEFGEVDALMVLPEEFLGDQFFDDNATMQRKLTWSRVRGDMKRYLLDFDDSFYSALTLFIVPRDLNPLAEGEGYTFTPAGPGTKHGVLTLRSTCVLFPGDGQHRGQSIKEALKADPKLASQEMPVVLIPFTHSAKVRQLFSDLNLNAKPVNKTIGISFETRDPIAVISKRVGELIPLFHNRVNRRTNSLPASSDQVITMNSLYQGTEEILSALGLSNVTTKETESALAVVVPVWQTLVDALPSWKDVLNNKLSPGDVREQFVHAFGLGWQAMAIVAAVVIKTEPDRWPKVLKSALQSVSWEKTNPDWQNVAMVGPRVNNTGSAIRATAGYVLEQAGITGQYAQPYLDVLKATRSAPQKP